MPPNSVIPSLHLVRDLSLPFAEPILPVGMARAPFGASLAPRGHALLRLAYAQGGGTVPDNFEDWWAATRRDSEFDASLCFAAMAGNDLAGFMLCWTSAFMKDLVVHPTYRRRGLGEAMLLTAFAAFADRGQSQVALRVEVGNAPARRLYQRMGFVEA